MKPKKSGALLLLFAATLGVLLPERAFAYLDPGTGSFLIQIVIAAVVGSLFTIKMWWHNIKNFIANIFSSSSAKSTDDE